MKKGYRLTANIITELLLQPVVGRVKKNGMKFLR